MPGPICENNFRRSLVMLADDYGIVIEQPISAAILMICALAILLARLPRWSLRFLKRGSAT